jgi:hypothetical protein
LSISQTGLWWNIPRNLGYMFGLTGEVRSRATLHTVDNKRDNGTLGVETQALQYLADFSVYQGQNFISYFAKDPQS